MAHWLVKTEPTSYSIEELQRDKTTAWDKVRNYQARNYLMQMKRGDKVLVYHSSNDVFVGVVGIATVHKESYPDPTQFDRKSDYFDEKATQEKPRWFCPDLKFDRKFSTPVALDDLRKIKACSKLELLRRGSRLSVHPVDDGAFEAIVKAGSR